MSDSIQPRPLFPAYQQATSSALFPACNDNPQETDHVKPTTDEIPKWLENKSYTAAALEIVPIENEEDNVASNAMHARKRKKHKKKHKKKRLKADHDLEPEESRKATLAVAEEKEINQHNEKKSFYAANKAKIFISDMPEMVPEHAFRVDRERDTNNWIYKSLYKLHIAKYRHVYQSCLGASYRQTMNWKERESQARRKDRLDQQRYYGKVAKSVLKEVTKFQQDQFAVFKERTPPVFSDYISFGASESEPVARPDSLRTVDSLNVYDLGTSLYVQGKGKPLEPTDSSNEEFIRDEMLQRTEYYNKALRDDPGNVKLWLDYVHFHDKNAEKQQMINSGSSSVTSLSHIEIKLAILTKAILANPTSVTLKIARIELGSGIWERDKVLEDWDTLLSIHSGNVDVWKQYLVFIQSYLPTFSVTHTMKSYHRCLKILRTIQDGKVQTQDVSADLESDMLEIFVQYCTFLCHSGHTEKAMATFQAMIEYNLFVPLSFSSLPHEERVAIFEAFWDSGVARFGESDAAGWRDWLEKRQMNIHERAETDGDLDNERAEDAILHRSQDKWKMWLDLESHRECQHVLPWRPDAAAGQTEEDCEDTDRLVLVDDVTPAMFVIGQLSVKRQVILRLLIFLGVQIHDLTQDNENSRVPCLASHMIDTLHQIEYRNVNNYYDYKSVLSNHILLSHQCQEFVRNILKQSISFFADDKPFQTGLTLALITYQLQTLLNQSGNNARLEKQKVKDLRKSVKALLKQPHNRNNLLIYAQYAKLESIIGKCEDAYGIIETVLTMQQGDLFTDSDISAQISICVLYHTYVAIALGLEDDTFTQSSNNYDISELNVMFAKSARVLTCLADGGKFVKRSEPTPVGSIDILRTRKKFRLLCDTVQNKVLECESKFSLQSYCALLLNVSICFVLYEYCVSGELSKAESELYSVESFCDMHSCAVSLVTDSCQCYANLRNNLLKFWIKLTKFHQSTSVIALSKQRALLTRALDHFPEDVYFLQEYVALENRTFTIGGVRRYFKRSLRQDMTSAVPAIYAILSEITRHAVLSEHTAASGTGDGIVTCTGLTHRIHALFERCLQIPACQHCVLIWRMYAHFEMKQGNNTRAEGVFYRSLQQCPWAKVLYKDAVSMFPGRLQELVDMMMEKDIRVQIPVEEIDILQESILQGDRNVPDTYLQDNS